MDTRTKFVSATEAARLAAEGATVVAGFFDPLLAWHAERLNELKREGTPLVVLITSPERPILPARARAELVASLRAVSYVCDEGGPEAQISLEADDARRFEELVAHVHARQHAAS